MATWYAAYTRFEDAIEIARGLARLNRHRTRVFRIEDPYDNEGFVWAIGPESQPPRRTT